MSPVNHSFGIMSGLKDTFINRYIVERTNKTEIRPEGQSEKTESCWELNKAALFSLVYFNKGAGIACWLERRTRDQKIANSNPGRSGGRNFFLRVNFVC